MNIGDAFNTTNIVIGFISSCISIITTIISIILYFRRTQLHQPSNAGNPANNVGCLDLAMAIVTGLFNWGLSTATLTVFIFFAMDFVGTFLGWIPHADELAKPSYPGLIIASFVLACPAGIVFGAYAGREIIRRVPNQPIP